MLGNAFNFLLSMASRPAQIKDINTNTVLDIMIADSNYFRKLEGFEEITIQGKEFVISANILNINNFTPKRGHRLIYEDNGKQDVIGEVRPMRIMGVIVGYRVRVE